MKYENDFFVKLNCKNIHNMRSLIIDRHNNTNNRYKDNKYIMCAGRYDKNGWTFVFRTKSYEEAEKIANLNLFEYTKSKVN